MSGGKCLGGTCPGGYVLEPPKLLCTPHTHSLPLVLAICFPDYLTTLRAFHLPVNHAQFTGEMFYLSLLRRCDDSKMMYRV